MKSKARKSKARKSARVHERGAALLMMLLVSTLVLAAGCALILSSVIAGTNSIDATAEKQAYYAAEAGLQMTMNALRGNMAHDSAVANGTKMGLRAAITPDLSNGAGRSPSNLPCVSDTPSAPTPCRLVGWLPYNVKNISTGVVPVDPNTNSSFRTAVFDPDRSNQVTYNTSGEFLGLNGIPGAIISPTQIKLGLGLDTITITFLPKLSTTVNAYPQANVDLGSFKVDKATALAALPLSLLQFVNFRLTVNQTAPWNSSATYKMTLGTPNLLSCPGYMFHVSVPRPGLKLQGTDITITGLNAGNLKIGCAVVGAAVIQQVQATIIAPEPRRVVVRSVGFGPNFARKQLEMSVGRADLGFEVPATLTVRGADDCSPINFSTGNSNAKTYTGNDQANPAEPPRPAFAVQQCDYDDVVSGTGKPGTVTGSSQVGIMDGSASGSMSSETVDTPPFLQTAAAARDYLNSLQLTAMGQGRYFKPAAGAAYSANEGTQTNPVLTFVDGDCNLSGGAGLLVVTGKLNLSGNPSFDGIILVLGEGYMNRSGGGSGNLDGAIVIASFQRTWPAADNNLPHPFLAPTFNTNGGGNSDVEYNSQSVARALGVLGSRVTGVLEY
jgi:hypothetical protein